MSGWQFWIDRGGTFTDLVGRRPDGGLVTLKLLSENPERYSDAALQGIRDLLGLGAAEPIPGSAVVAVKMGTTVATNALLERKGDRVLLVTNRGFADALRIGYQNRPRLFERCIRLPELLHERVIEVGGRMAADGEELEALDEAEAAAGLAEAFAAGIRAVAILFMHGYRYPDHERRVAELAGRQGFTQISVSHQVSPLMKLVSRGDTTVVDAYLSPILRRYVDRVAGELGGVRLMFMQSNGGLTDAGRFQGKDSILSGPAGGVVGMARTAQAAGFAKVIGFDMGGTSTDVAHFDGAYERAFETQIAGVRLRAPMMRIHTVAAGGGSILHFDGARFRVGPDSAGANPGPTAYRRGGPLTVTDCNLLVGKIQPDFFPRVFGPGGDQPLDGAAVRARFAALAGEIAAATDEVRSPEAVAEGFLRVAVENMANAIKQISVQRGHDVTEYALNCFGGAGGQHACLVADALGMTTVLIHPFAGLLSAYGMGLADVRALRERTVEQPFDDELPAVLEARLAELDFEARQAVIAQGVPAKAVVLERRIHVRYAGTDTALPVPHGTPAAMAESFAAAHRQRFGFAMPERGLVAEAASVEAIGAGEGLADRLPLTPEGMAADAPAPETSVRLYTGGVWHQAPVFARHRLARDSAVDGPAIIAETNATTVVEPGWRATTIADGSLVLRRVAQPPRRSAIGTAADPIMLEIFNNLFMSVAEQMGATLVNTASSVNIKERLDFSCAIFDRDGQLVANAPHIPVHLGSMGESVQTVIRQRAGAMAPGDVYALNAPYNGGTHLPDVTVITPVFADDGGGSPLFFVGARGHHADIGGLTPGSMPPASRTVDEEGVLIDDFTLVERGRFCEAELRALLAGGPYPARNILQNIADLKAQIAANAMGVRELRRLVAHFGLEVVEAYMRHVQDNAEESVRRVIDRLSDGSFTYAMDGGETIRVAVRVDRAARRARIDFTGTSAQSPTNFNAPTAVTKAAVLYVFRTLVDDDIPLNAGCLKPLEIVIPEGSLLNPRPPAAVVAGNVETSQCVTDALYGALGMLAGAQGTMNNFTFGDDRHQYYETICGGAGAGPGFAGQHAVQTHMTNSRLTDPEVLEWRFPVVLDGFAIRRGSGGTGRWPGGDGVVRRIRFRRAMTAAILSGHRRVPPFGLDGGGPGALGINRVERADGTVERLAGTAIVAMNPGDVFVIETPGGGGCGSPEGDER
ncbi:MAG: hydantoinase B/oxoprolinase family protein [Rhodospirillales bacterium]|nr:hydantoinase B/oxoprolinase family protein [Rhodospirillales bacterium]